MDKQCLTQLDKLQNKLVRQCVGLGKYCYISPLLRATGVIPVSDSIVYQCLDLCKNCVLSDSIASDFYCELLSANIQTAKNRTFIGRAMNYVTGHNFYCVPEGAQVTLQETHGKLN